MADEAGSTPTPSRSMWDRLGLVVLTRTFRLTIWPPGKLVTALAAIILTVGWVGFLDWVSGSGASQQAIDEYIDSEGAAENVAGDRGVFDVFLQHQRNCAGSVCCNVFASNGDLSGTLDGAGAVPAGNRTILDAVRRMGGGVCWLLSEHTIYAIFLGLGCLAIWSIAGGMICRMAALQFALDQTMDMSEGLAFARRKWGSLVSAPLIPLGCVLFAALALYVVGFILRVPWVGDLVGGVLVLPAIIAGFIVALALVGLIPAASLAWPAIAVDDADGFDAIAGRGYAYCFQRPVKAIWYAGVCGVIGCVCWIVIKWLVGFALAVTHVCVGAGTRWFGTAVREHNGDTISKLDAVWPFGGQAGFYAWPDSERLTGFAGGDYISTLLIGIWVMLVIGLMWAFLASFFFTSATAVYYLLRRDVDMIDLSDVCIEEEEQNVGASTEPAPEDPAPTGTVSLPIIQEPPPESEAKP